MNMYFYQLRIRYQNNRVTDFRKESAELLHLAAGKRMFQVDDKFCAVTEFNIFVINCLDILFCGLWFCEVKVDLLTHQRVIRALQYHHKPLASGVHNAGFLQNGKHFRRFRQRLVSIVNNRFQIGGKIHLPVRKLPGYF